MQIWPTKGTIAAPKENDGGKKAMAADRLNHVTHNLPQYPMEELKRIKAELVKQNIDVMDFGVGDPRLPMWEPIREAIRNALPQISQYPSIMGLDELNSAQSAYLQKRLGIRETIFSAPTRGSKEGIFHIALSIVGRGGRKRIIYPEPGYPVYLSSIEFSGGVPTPFALNAKNAYLLKPWELPTNIIRETAAIWINYPHNPTGAVAPKEYLQKIVTWCRENDIILLSDECYLDIYDPAGPKPHSALEFGADNVIAFFSLSKRSGTTGYRLGFMAGDEKLLKPHLKARANFGVAMPEFLQKGAVVAWSDDQHVAKRREIFQKRIDIMVDALKEAGFAAIKPQATFYVWCPIPTFYKGSDIDFCLGLAKRGVLTTPATWLGSAEKDVFRLAMVEDEDVTKRAARIMGAYIDELR